MIAQLRHASASKKLFSQEPDKDDLRADYASKFTKVNLISKRREYIRRSAIRLNKLDERREDELQALEKEFARLSRRMAQLSDSAYEANLKERIETLKAKLQLCQDCNPAAVDLFKEQLKEQHKSLQCENDVLENKISQYNAKISEFNSKQKKLEEKIRVFAESNECQNSFDKEIVKKSKEKILAKLFRTRYVVGLGEYTKIKLKLQKELSECKEMLEQKKLECTDSDKRIAELEEKIIAITRKHELIKKDQL
eukprot:TRINITY_DN12248_c0_g1_i1.p1 TRINITY_DN12248_c0_g1~~TRINITY_DN12248_c0_g1_i1.p1  ORF type:complete len:253 (-),score=67.42 TRINITY_DN12248_c0_g1_i1:73-831(-)